MRPVTRARAGSGKNVTRRGETMMSAIMHFRASRSLPTGVTRRGCGCGCGRARRGLAGEAPSTLLTPLPLRERARELDPRATAERDRVRTRRLGGTAIAGRVAPGLVVEAVLAGWADPERSAAVEPRGSRRHHGERLGARRGVGRARLLVVTRDRAQREGNTGRGSKGAESLHEVDDTPTGSAARIACTSRRGTLIGCARRGRGSRCQGRR